MAVVNHCTGCGCRHAVATAHSCGQSLPAAVGSAPHTCGIGDHVVPADHCSAGDLEDVLQVQRPAFLILSSLAPCPPEPFSVVWLCWRWADAVLASEL
jgi:hypothetical protein